MRHDTLLKHKTSRMSPKSISRGIRYGYFPFADANTMTHWVAKQSRTLHQLCTCGYCTTAFEPKHKANILIIIDYIALNMCNGFYFSVENTFFSDKHPTCTQQITGTCILLPRVADKLDCLDLLLFNEGLATGSNPPPTPPHRPPTRLSLCCHQRKRACVCKAINGV